MDCYRVSPLVNNARNDSGLRITLVDDVVTRGASFVGMMPHLQRGFPGCEINCFALVRTQSYDAVDQIVAAVEGVITCDCRQLLRVP
jgi:orotate phosphoribosyltransferase